MPKARPALSIAALCVSALSLAAEPVPEFRADIQPLLQKHCFECHGPSKHKADLNLAAYEDFEQVTAAPEVWERVLERVQAYEMPPKGKPELDFSEHGKLMTWLRQLPRTPQSDCDQVASDRNTSFYHGYVMSRRLNRAEYNNTIRDLAGLDLHLQELLPADGGGGEGFDTSGSALFTSSIHVEKYLAAADRVVDSALKSPRILVAQPSASKSARQAAREVVEAFAHRAFRRPVAAEELERFLTLFDRGWERGDGYMFALRLPLKAVLVSPSFLFLAEPEPTQGGVLPLDGVSLASKLSYFIWSSMPDDELLVLGENGGLLQDEVYLAQVRRLLADPKAEALGERFALQWLDLDRLGGDVRPDPKKFPEFDADLNAAMHAEVTEFFNHLLRENRSLLELIDSDYTFVNARLAKLYRLESVSGSAMRQVQLHDPNRGGIATMPAVAALNSFPGRTSPVLRGRWILEAMLGDKIPPPPPGTPALEESSGRASQPTVRAQLEVHRAKPECASCHSKMDPLGFSLENFDPLGRWRTEENGQPIDAEGVLASGETFAGPSGLKRVLKRRKDDVMRHLIRKMMGFAYGRELNQFDKCVVDRTLTALQANEYRADVLVEQIASSFPFRHRFYAKDTEGK